MGKAGTSTLKAKLVPPIPEAATAWGTQLFFNVLNLEHKNTFTIWWIDIVNKFWEEIDMNC